MKENTGGELSAQTSGLTPRPIALQPMEEILMEFCYKRK
jgi:hypothetical protein